MELLIVRHGPAGGAAEKEAWRRGGRPDSERPLTKDGKRKTRAAAKGLAKILDGVDLVATSPWTRAAQTAALVAAELDAKVVELPELIPDRKFDELLARLKKLRARRVAVVGHDPHLSGFASWLLAGGELPFVRLKKPQALLLELNAFEPGAAELVWSLPPRQLRALGE